MKKTGSMLVRVDGALRTGVSAKDVVLAIIGRIGTAGGTGYSIEFGGDAIGGDAGDRGRHNAFDDVGAGHVPLEGADQRPAHART